MGRPSSSTKILQPRRSSAAPAGVKGERVDIDELKIPAEIRSFVENISAYHEKTRDISNGNYNLQ